MSEESRGQVMERIHARIGKVVLCTQGLEQLLAEHCCPHTNMAITCSVGTTEGEALGVRLPKNNFNGFGRSHSHTNNASLHLIPVGT